MEQQSVWLRALGVSSSDWTEGMIVSVRKPWLRNCRVRIQFLAPFPYESFKTLVYGTDYLRDIADTGTPEHEKDHLWK
jgi:hypothetical protein